MIIVRACRQVVAALSSALSDTAGDSGCPLADGFLVAAQPRVGESGWLAEVGVVVDA